MARGAMVVMKDELVKGLYRLSRNTVTGGGGAAPRKKKKGSWGGVIWKDERCCNRHFKESISSKPKLWEEQKEHQVKGKKGKIHIASRPEKRAIKRKVTFALIVGSMKSACYKDANNDGNKWTGSLQNNETNVFKKSMKEKIKPRLDLIVASHWWDCGCTSS